MDDIAGTFILADGEEYGLPRIEDFARYIDDGTIERILKKAEKLRDLHIVNVSDDRISATPPP